MHQGFRWQVDADFNMAEVCCRRWARAPDATKNIAIRAHVDCATGTFHSYFELGSTADRISRQLRALGVQQGDRVAIVMPQRFETAAAYMAVLQMGAVAMPLSILFGPEALEFRLQDSEAVIAICDESSIGNIRHCLAQCPALRQIIAVGAAAGQGDVAWDASSAAAPFEMVCTRADDPAILIYTSGTTGQPKGALIPHRALIGNLTGFVCSQNWFGFDGARKDKTDAVFWSPADWAWTGGLMDALLPT